MRHLHGKTSLVSIILPFKNEEDYLGECIDSIINQTYVQWELILVDDNSTDASPRIAQNSAKNDKRIRYFKNPNSGVIEALQYGFKQSTGNLISRMDGDDIKTIDNLDQLVCAVSPGTIAIGQVQYFRSDGLGAGYSQYQQWLNERTKTNNSFAEIYKECVVPSPCWLAHRDDFLKSGGFESNKYPEDYDLCFRFYEAGLKTQGTVGIIHQWRDHPTRTTRVSKHYSDNRFMQLKLHYFSLIDLNPAQELVLWGAGKKGKAIAKYWTENGILFSWLTDNKNKIGHNIYGTVLESTETFDPSPIHQVVIAVADKQGQLDIQEKINGTKSDVLWFC